MSTVTTIKRGGLTAAIDSMGAQLTSLALDGNEYLWQGDPAFWGKHAPILFPIVGSLRNNTATSAAGTCEMPRHGLARIVEHKLVEVSEDGSSVTYEITDTPESLHARIQAQEHEAYPEALRLLAAGRLRVDGRRVRLLP